MSLVTMFVRGREEEADSDMCCGGRVWEVVWSWSSRRLRGRSDEEGCADL